MSVSLAAMACVAFSWGKLHYQKVYKSAGSGRANIAAYFLALCTILPFLFLLLIYTASNETVSQHILLQELPAYTASWDPQTLSLFFDQIVYQVEHRSAPPSPVPLVDVAASRYSQIQGILRLTCIGSGVGLSCLGYFFAWRYIKSGSPLRLIFERCAHLFLFACAAIAVLTTAGIVTSLVYLSEYATPHMREALKPVLEILAGIPTVIYGFFAALLIAPLVRQASLWFNGLAYTPDAALAAQPTNALAAGLVMGVMIIPLMSSLCDDILRTIPRSLRDGALAVGATQSETITQIVLPAALPGIVAAFLLSASRAIGETMIVVMAAGGRAVMTVDPTSDMTTVTHQIVTILTGDTSFDSPRTLSAFALGFALFGFTLIFNIIALRIVRYYRVRYV